MPIELAAYSARDTFEREIGTLFTARYFVGRASDFPEKDYYRSFLLGDKVITVRRTTEGIRAFGNACLHRSNLIDPLGDGKKHFSCGFHGWSYDAEGALSLAPMADIQCIHRRQLPRFRLQQVNDLLFLDLGEATSDVAKVPGVLAQAGITFSQAFHRGQLHHSCNWKLMVDNVLEGYHLNFIHRNTFLKSGFNSASRHIWNLDQYTVVCHVETSPDEVKAKSLLRLLPNASHSYRHAYIFPNLVLSSTNNLIGYMGRMEPVSEDRTLLHWELFELPELLKLPQAIREHLRKEAIEFATTTLEEDRAVIESSQVGIRSRMGGFQLQPSEERVTHFHNYYQACMHRAC